MSASGVARAKADKEKLASIEAEKEVQRLRDSGIMRGADPINNELKLQNVLILKQMS